MFAALQSRAVPEAWPRAAPSTRNYQGEQPKLAPSRCPRPLEHLPSSKRHQARPSHSKHKAKLIDWLDKITAD
jgi:hypothetical protein